MSNNLLPNIIFLDIDGVLCNPATCVAVGDVGGCYSYFDPMSCGLIKKLCVDNNCKLVISSSWRKLHDCYSIKAMLNAVCPQLGNFMYTDARWCTESFNGVTIDQHGRGKEIQAWINKYSKTFNGFIIIDDDSDMEPLMDSLIQTDVYEGFRFKDYMKANSYLKLMREDL